MNLADEIRVKCAEAMGWRYPGSSCLKLESWDRWIPPTGSNTRKVPNYPASVDAALTLCDRLREEGWCLQITYGVTDKWTVTFYQGHGRFFTVQDPSLARAICLAFLKVKGEAK